ncbi:class I adenylate-forming enzyme family protein [Streptomyces sp. NPDC048255]|uniref:class I adenylate-forming enzyme family protein n=1 Tax=Streptomyces sp. NPDC048255 TaxID=3154713 RepID=UPI003404400B
MRFLHDLLEKQCKVEATRPALTAGGVTWSYGELRSRAMNLAERLSGFGVVRGDRVVIHAPNGPGTVAALFACSYAGAVAVVLNPRVRPFHLDHIAADCAPALALVVPELTGAHTGTGVRTVVLEADLWEAGPALAAAPSTPASRPEGEPADGDRSEDDLACLIYTSGSTGMPKAVMSPHRQMAFAIDAIGQVLGYAADDTVFSCTPLSFDYGLYQVFLSLAAGAHLVLDGDASAGPALLRRLEETEATVFPLVPALAATLVRLAARAGAHRLKLRLVTNTGAALGESHISSLRAAIPGLRVAPMYGLTECKRVSILEPENVDARPGSVGRPLPGTSCAVVDEEGRVLPPGSGGELVVSGPHVMPGYWNAPELTGIRFRPGPDGRHALYTGDQCRMDEDGYIYFLGRDDDVYKRKGFRVSTMEIEQAALDISGVDQAAALSPVGDGPAHLFVSGEVNVPEILAGLRDRLEPHKIPEVCEVLETLPLTPHGKIDKAALGSLTSAGTR